MFLGMSFCLPLAFLEQWQQRRRQAAAGAEEAEARYPLLNNAVAEESFVSTGTWPGLPVTRSGWLLDIWCLPAMRPTCPYAACDFAALVLTPLASCAPALCSR